MPQLPNILVDAIPGFILLIIVEVIFAIKTQRELYEVKDAATSISLGLGNLFAGILTKTIILFVLCTAFLRCLRINGTPGFYYL